MKLQKLPATKVLIKVEREQKTNSGVFVPDSSNVKEVAKVIQVGKEVTFCKEGDSVLFKTWALSNYKINDEEFSIIDEEHIDGIL